MTSRRVPIAIITNSLAPYRIHLHRRIVALLPEIDLWTVLTYRQVNVEWTTDTIGLQVFDCGDDDKLVTQRSLRSRWSEWMKGGRICRWLGERKIGAVLLEGYSDVGHLRILRWCRMHSIPCFMFGDSNILCDRSSGAKALVKRLCLVPILRRTSGILPCGSAGRRYFAKYGVPEARMFPYPYEADYNSIIKMGEAERSTLLAPFGLSETRRYLLFSGRLAPEKRVDLLIDAFAEIAADRPGWDLVIVGDGPELESLRARLPSRLGERVRWLGFVQDRQLLHAVYRSCQVLVLPSAYEPWGIVVSEAAAAGLAIVASDIVGAAQDLLQDGVNGYFFPSGNPGVLAHRLRAVTDGDAAAALGRASSRILQDFRVTADPVEGLRRALRSAAVI